MIVARTITEPETGSGRKYKIKELRESISHFDIAVFRNCQLTENSRSVTDRTDLFQIEEIRRKLTDLTIDTVILLGSIDDIQIIVTMKDKGLLQIVAEVLEIAVVSIQGDLIDQDQATGHIIATDIRELELIAAFDIVVAEDTPVLTLPFLDKPELLSCDLSKHSRLAAAGETKITRNHDKTPKSL